MATESSSPKQVDDKVLSGEYVKEVEDGGAPAGKGDITKEKDGNWPFANSEPVREDQVQNAVKFLSHSKVRGSPIIYRRSFLEKKGLTKDEIDEAFRRVPDLPSQESAVRITVPTPERQSMPLTTLQTQSPVQILQHSARPVTASTAAMVQSSRFQWRHMLFALGLLSVSGAGTGVLLKKAVIPRFKSWIRWIASESDESEQMKALGSSPVEEAVAAAKYAATAAAEVANASGEMLKSKLEDSKHLERLMHSLEEQTREMKYMKIALQEIENHRHEFHVASGQSDNLIANKTNRGKSNSAWGGISSISQLEHGGVPQTISKNFKADANVSTVDQRLVRPSSGSATANLSQAPYSNSYIEEENDKPPNPNQPPSNPFLQPRTKPWETIQSQSSNSQHSTYAQHIQTVNSSAVRDGMKPAVNGFSNVQPKSTNPVNKPWWQAKKNETELSLGFSAPSESNVRIAEMESSDEEVNDGIGYELPSRILVDTVADRPGNNSLHDSSGSTWVPPPPPPVAMPQAAEAIWQPKSKTQIQDLNLTSEVSDSSGSVMRPEITDDQFMPPRVTTEQEEHVSSSSDVENITENNKEEIDRLSVFVEETSSETPTYKDVVNEVVEETEDL
ncbi:hypothetical protein KI387_015655 [Taxus chinensis]|uniref:Peroxisomal membrane protein PEX14 n=3 Tax=Taxus chinensis TaxID=29808 RepID=A0AA38GD44_TAXCH|nr:hypothetical protein KI387_015655 [Taxus chinensis]